LSGCDEKEAAMISKLSGGDMSPAEIMREIAFKFFRGNSQLNREGYIECGLIQQLEDAYWLLEDEALEALNGP
jgi:hypothetical protein